LLDDLRRALLDNSVLRKSLLAAAAQAKSTGQNVHIDFMQSSRYMHGVCVFSIASFGTANATLVNNAHVCCWERSMSQ
jgi:hypothetical protein